ncbi:MAG: hypothetical protein ABSA49_03225 [Rhizomicrobium sp.]|jgi:hypothetical protein
MPPVSKINLGIKALRRDNPWPEFGYGEIEPFYLPLDGGGRSGREIVFDVIKEREIELMFEVGCFLCGSSLQWLRTSEKLKIVGVDPWDSNWASYIERIAVDPVRARTVYHLNDKQIETIVHNIRRYGNYCVALNNVRLYKERFFPVRRKAPEAFHYLHEREIIPGLIYIDADKKREDLDTAHKLFPDAVLCGDDWLWPDDTGVFRMQEHVKAFATEHRCEIRSARQTWLLIPRESVKDKSAATVAT